MFPAQSDDQFQKFPDPFGINSQRGFIQDDDLRFFDQYIRQSESLAHSPGIFSYFLFGYLAETNLV